MKKRHVTISIGLKDDFQVGFYDDEGNFLTCFNFIDIKSASEAAEKWLRTVNPSGIRPGFAL